MSELTQPWVWYGLGLVLAAILLYVARMYEQGILPQARETLEQPTLVGAEIDPVDPDAWTDQELIEHEFSGQVEAWLRARNEYDRWQQG